jgi:hypothetical protein
MSSQLIALAIPGWRGNEAPESVRTCDGMVWYGMVRYGMVWYEVRRCCWDGTGRGGMGRDGTCWAVCAPPETRQAPPARSPARRRCGRFARDCRRLGCPPSPAPHERCARPATPSHTVTCSSPLDARCAVTRRKTRLASQIKSTFEGSVVSHPDRRTPHVEPSQVTWYARRRPCSRASLRGGWP